MEVFVILLYKLLSDKEQILGVAADEAAANEILRGQ